MRIVCQGPRIAASCRSGVLGRLPDFKCENPRNNNKGEEVDEISLLTRSVLNLEFSLFYFPRVARLPSGLLLGVDAVKAE